MKNPTQTVSPSLTYGYGLGELNQKQNNLKC